MSEGLLFDLLEKEFVIGGDENEIFGVDDLMGSKLEILFVGRFPFSITHYR